MQKRDHSTPDQDSEMTMLASIKNNVVQQGVEISLKINFPTGHGAEIFSLLIVRIFVV
jgi:hypothetical protein